MNGFDFYIMNAKCNENDYEGLATAKRSKQNLLRLPQESK